MTKDRIWKINSHLLKGLSLCLVDCHGVGRSKGQLISRTNDRLMLLGASLILGIRTCLLSSCLRIHAGSTQCLLERTYLLVLMNSLDPNYLLTSFILTHTKSIVPEKKETKTRIKQRGLSLCIHNLKLTFLSLPTVNGRVFGFVFSHEYFIC